MKQDINNIQNDKIAIGWHYPKLWKMFGAEFISKAEMSKIFFGTAEFAKKIVYVEHHIAHACAVLFILHVLKMLWFLLLMDKGKKLQLQFFLGDKSKTTLRKLYETPISLGYFYAAVTEHIVFFLVKKAKLWD